MRPGDARAQRGPLPRTWGRWSLWMLCPHHMEKPVLLLRGQNQARPGALRGRWTQRELLLAGASQAREGETPPPQGVIKPGRGLLELFQGQGASPWPPTPPPFLLLLPPPSPQGRGRGLVEAPEPWPSSACLPEKEEGQCPEPAVASASPAQQRGLCDPLTAAVPWRQRPADRRPPCQQHDRCRPALPGSAPGAVTRAGPAHRPALGRGLSSAGLEVCRPFPAPPGWPPPSCPPRLFRKGTHLSPWPGESREPSAHSPQPGYPRGPRPRRGQSAESPRASVRVEATPHPRERDSQRPSLHPGSEAQVPLDPLGSDMGKLGEQGMAGNVIPGAAGSPPQGKVAGVSRGQPGAGLRSQEAGGGHPGWGWGGVPLTVRPRGAEGRPSAGAALAQPARERGSGAAGGRALRHGRPLAGHGWGLPRGDGGLRPPPGRLGPPRRHAPPLAIPRGVRRLPGRLQVDPALRACPGALSRPAAPLERAGGAPTPGDGPPFTLVCLTAQHHRPLWVQAGLRPSGTTGDRVFVSAARPLQAQS